MAGMELVGVSRFLDGLEDMTDTFSGDSEGYRMATNIDYAVHQEFGTASQSGTPHFRPGMDAAKAKMGELALQADSMDEWLRLTALQWEAETKDRAPVDFGTLKASYQTDPL